MLPFGRTATPLGFWMLAYPGATPPVPMTVAVVLLSVIFAFAFTVDAFDDVLIT
jgi:hypothetical protein